MFQWEDEEFDLNEEFLEDIFQRTGPQRSNEGSGDVKKPGSSGQDIPITGNGNGKTKVMVERSPGSNSSPVSKRAKFLCDSELSLIPSEQGFLDFRIEENASSAPKSSTFSFKTASDNIASQKIERGIFGHSCGSSIESPKFTNKSPTNQACHSHQQDYSNSSNARRRKFPGPAGLLPELDKKRCYPDLSQLPAESIDRRSLYTSSDAVDESETTLSQPCAVGSLFGNDSPWASLRHDFNLNSSDSNRGPLSKICLKWARQKATARQLPAHKVPFLAVAIHALDCSSPDPCVILRDPTGEMGGTLHREVWDRHGYLLHPGAAMALRQVGVLSTGAAARRHYLNITENNLLSIYSSAKIENGPYTFRKVDEMSTSEIKITKIRPLDINEVKKCLQEMQSTNQATVNPAIFPPVSPSLYSSASSVTRPHFNSCNSLRPAPYRSPNPANVLRFNCNRTSSPIQGQAFASIPRSPTMPSPNVFTSSPLQSSSWNPVCNNAVSMDVQCSSSPPTSIHTPTSSHFTPKFPAWKSSVNNTQGAGSFVPKQPFLNKFPVGHVGSPAGPYNSGCSGASSPNLSLSSPEGSTAMDITVGPSIPSNCEKAISISPTTSYFERKGMTDIAGAECRKSQALEEAELDSILGGIDTDLLFDDDDF
ncbi:uncharacterized protein [Hetaerina americana]|uniref:uncharacterized protein n=1 Tax=Hetaerina americana TaxID=62018 RepID=UPI003A7F5D4C